MSCPSCNGRLEVAQPDDLTRIHYCPGCGTPPQEISVLKQLVIVGVILAAVATTLVLLPLYRIKRWWR